MTKTPLTRFWVTRNRRIELAGDDGAGNKKGEEAEDPVDEGGGAGLLDDRALDGEEHDRHEDRDHVESTEDFGQDAGRDPLGEQLSGSGGRADGCGCRCHNPSLRVLGSAGGGGGAGGAPPPVPAFVAISIAPERGCQRPVISPRPGASCCGPSWGGGMGA